MLDAGVSPCMCDSGHRFTLCYMTGRPVCWASSIPFAPPRLITEKHCSLNIYDFPAVYKEIGNIFFPLWEGPGIIFRLYDRDHELFFSSLTELRNRFFPLWQGWGIGFPLFDRDQEYLFFFFDRDQESLVYPLTEIIFRIISLCQGTGIVCFLFDRDQELLFPLWQRSGITCFVFYRDKKLLLSSLTGIRKRFLFDRNQKPLLPLWIACFLLKEIRNRLFPLWQRSWIALFPLW